MSNPTNMQDFIKAVKEDLTARLEGQYPGIEVEHDFIEKAQGESYDGIRLHVPGQSVAPVINIDPFYEQVTTTVPYREVIEDIDYHAQEALAKFPEISVETFSSYEEMKGKLIMQAIPIKGNEEMLINTPHHQMEDIAIIYRFVMGENERGTMSAVVTNDMMAKYGISPDELRADAAQAMKYEHPYEIRPLFDVLGAMSPELAETEQPDNMLYVATYASPMYGAGVTGLCVYNIGSAILRAVGDSRKPLYFLIFSSLVNIILDMLFVVRFDLGVAGVAYATILAQFLSSILVLYVLFRSKEVYGISLREMKVDRMLLRQIITIGIPGAVQMALTSFSNLFVQGYVNDFGAASTAGWGAYQRIDAFSMLPAMSLGMAITTFTGQNAGAGKYDRIKKGLRTALFMGIAVTASVSIVLFIFAPQAIGLFNRKPDVLYFGSLYLRMITPFAFLICFTQMFSGTLRGIGDAKAPMIIMLLSFVAFRQVYLFVASRLTDSIYPISVAFPVGWALCSVLFVIYYKKTIKRLIPEIL